MKARVPRVPLFLGGDLEDKGSLQGSSAPSSSCSYSTCDEEPYFAAGHWGRVGWLDGARGQTVWGRVVAHCLRFLLLRPYWMRLAPPPGQLGTLVVRSRSFSALCSLCHSAGPRGHLSTNVFALSRVGLMSCWGCCWRRRSICSSS